MTILMRFNGYHDDSEHYRYSTSPFTEGEAYELVNGSVKRYIDPSLFPSATFISNNGDKRSQELQRFTYIKKSESEK